MQRDDPMRRRQEGGHPQDRERGLRGTPRQTLDVGLRGVLFWQPQQTSSGSGSGSAFRPPVRVESFRSGSAGRASSLLGLRPKNSSEMFFKNHLERCPLNILRDRRYWECSTTGEGQSVTASNATEQGQATKLPRSFKLHIQHALSPRQTLIDLDLDQEPSLRSPSPIRGP